MKMSNDEKILNCVVSKAWKDTTFKAKLLERPLETIEEFLGYKVNLPQGKKISFVDQSDESTIYVNIPVEPNMEDMELDETNLDIISGGNGTIPVIIKTANYSGDNLFDDK